jgi:polyhydroxybutyrate depolymerase
MNRTLLVTIVILLASSVACGKAVQARQYVPRPMERNPGAAFTGCGQPFAKGLTPGTMTSGGVERTYRLYVPSSYDPNLPTALVLNFHGFTGSGRQQEANSHMTDEAERSGFITVAADGTESPRRWHIYGRLENGYDEDFAFVRELIGHLSASLCIDSARVYATGISNGGGMTSLIGCELNDLVAAIAPVAGTIAPRCPEGRPMPVIAFHGTDDQLVPFEGGPSGRLGLPSRGVRAAVRQWAGHNGCDPTPKSERVAVDVLLESYDGCRDGADVALYVVEGGGHSWPGS